MSRLFGEAKVAPIGATQARQLVQVLSAPGRAPSSSDYITQIVADARYAAIGHTHSIAQVTGLQTALDGKQPASENLSDWDYLLDLIGNGAGGYIQRVNGGWVVNSKVPTTDLTGILQAAQFPALTGDVTTTAGSLATTLATVIAAGGPVGNSSTVPVITYDTKGRLVAVSSQAITPAAIGALPAPVVGGNVALFLRGDGTWSNTLFGSSASLAVHVAVTSCNSGSNRVVHNAAAYDWGHTFQGNGVDLMDVSANLVTMSGDLTIAGCKFRDDVFSSTGYALYPSGVTPSNTNAVLYFAKNGTVVGISGSGSASLSINGSPVATATSAGLSIPSLAGGGMVRAAAGGLLQIAVAADLPGGPYLPLTAGSSKVISGTLYLNNGMQCVGQGLFDDLLINRESTFYGDISQPGRAGHRSAQLLDVTADSLAFAAAGNGGIKGRTNASDAEDGDVGERITSAITSSSTVSISTSGTAIDMLSISLPGGDWDVWANIIFSANVSGTTRARSAISLASATVTSDGYEADDTIATVSGAKLTQKTKKRVSVSVATTVYACAIMTGTFGAGACWGSISARRRR